MCPVKVNSNTIELTVCVSLSTLLVIAPYTLSVLTAPPHTSTVLWFFSYSKKIS